MKWRDDVRWHKKETKRMADSGRERENENEESNQSDTNGFYFSISFLLWLNTKCLINNIRAITFVLR